MNDQNCLYIKCSNICYENIFIWNFKLNNFFFLNWIFLCIDMNFFRVNFGVYQLYIHQKYSSIWNFCIFSIRILFYIKIIHIPILILIQIIYYFQIYHIRLIPNDHKKNQFSDSTHKIYPKKNIKISTINQKSETTSIFNKKKKQSFKIETWLHYVVGTQCVQQQQPIVQYQRKRSNVWRERESRDCEHHKSVHRTRRVRSRARSARDWHSVELSRPTTLAPFTPRSFSDPLHWVFRPPHWILSGFVSTAVELCRF